MPVTTNNDSIQQTLEQSEAKNELSGNIQKDKGLVHGEAILGMKNLIADISKNPFAISQKQGPQYADNGEIMNDGVNCDINGDGVIKGPKERVCQIKAENQQLDAKKEQLDAKKEQLDAKKEQLDSDIQQLNNDIQQLNQSNTKLTDEIKQKIADINRRKQELNRK
ncbi:MAG: hypothetical protein PHS49_07725 [Candidatus Gracilibacteria bacterium]|nr:hypothetical protein [Candidatus Gracilibacteria bacterium]